MACREDRRDRSGGHKGRVFEGTPCAEVMEMGDAVKGGIRLGGSGGPSGWWQPCRRAAGWALRMVASTPKGHRMGLRDGGDHVEGALRVPSGWWQARRRATGWAFEMEVTTPKDNRMDLRDGGNHAEGQPGGASG